MHLELNFGEVPTPITDAWDTPLENNFVLWQGENTSCTSPIDFQSTLPDLDLSLALTSGHVDADVFADCDFNPLC
jgi:hypothetical protein